MAASRTSGEGVRRGGAEGWAASVRPVVLGLAAVSLVGVVALTSRTVGGEDELGRGGVVRNPLADLALVEILAVWAVGTWALWALRSERRWALRLDAALAGLALYLLDPDVDDPPIASPEGNGGRHAASQGARGRRHGARRPGDGGRAG